MSNVIVGVAAGSTPVQTMTGPSASMPARPKMSNLFDQIDTTGSGSITKDQFSSAFQSMNPPGGFKAMGESAVYAKLDPNHAGSVSKNAFVNTMSALSLSLAQAPVSAAADTSTPASTGATGAFINTAV